MRIQRLSGRGFLNGEKDRKNKGDDLMKDRQFHIYLDDEEYGQVLQALIALKNNLIAQDRYTDAVDDVLIKFTKARKKRMTVQYI